MTDAVCVRCGARRFGALGRCSACGFAPTSDDDLALALVLTDHYQSRENLTRIAEAIKAGHPPKLDPGTRRDLQDAVDLARKLTGIRPHGGRGPT